MPWILVLTKQFRVNTPDRFTDYNILGTSKNYLLLQNIPMLNEFKEYPEVSQKKELYANGIEY